jgi:hypothetical protein
LLPSKLYNGQPERGANGSVDVLAYDLGKFASRHGYAIYRNDEVARMDAGFGGSRFFDNPQDFQAKSVIVFRLLGKPREAPSRARQFNEATLAQYERAAKSAGQ